MAIFLPGLLLGLAVLVSLTGWGRLLAGKSSDKAESAADWLEAPAWGIAISSLIGSILNLVGWANRFNVACFVLLGCALAGWQIISPLNKAIESSAWRRMKPDWRWLAALALPLAALALRFAGSVLITTFFPYSGWSANVYLNPQDDSLSYLVSPERMLQTGTLGADPFNSRQMMSALGAQHFLNAMALAVLRPENVHVIEGGAGLAAACLAAAGLGMRLRLGRVGATLLMLVPLMDRPWYINISSTLTTVGPLIALGSALAQLFKPHTNQRRWFIIAGLLLAAVCSLKSTTIPTACILVAVAAGFSALVQKSWKPLHLGLLTGLAGLAIMAPWMWWQYQSSGTPLYPLFGRGFHVEAFFPSAFQPFHGDAVQALEAGLVLPWILLLGLLAAWAWPPVRAAADRAAVSAALGITAGWIAAWPLIAISTEYGGVERYLLAARIASLVVVLACVWQAGLRFGGQSRQSWAGWAGPVLLGAILLGNSAEIKRAYGLIAPRDLANSVAGFPYAWAWPTSEALSAQATVPAHAKILAYTDRPFLFDFNANDIFVADWPGEASPPPGLPVRQGSEAVATYLLGHGICYVIYAYGDSADFPREIYGSYLNPKEGHVVNRTAALSFAFQDDLAQLALTRARLFDDGRVFVLDLTRKREVTAPASPPSAR